MFDRSQKNLGDFAEPQTIRVPPLVGALHLPQNLRAATPNRQGSPMPLNRQGLARIAFSQVTTLPELSLPHLLYSKIWQVGSEPSLHLNGSGSKKSLTPLH